MESQSRAYLTEVGDDPGMRWVLVGALLNQGMVDDAWRAATSDGVLQPIDAQTASVWARLHAEFAPGSGTRRQIADLLEEYLDDEQPATAILAALLRPGGDEEATDPEAERWNGVVNRFLERYPNSQAFQRIDIGENVRTSGPTCRRRSKIGIGGLSTSARSRERTNPIRPSCGCGWRTL